MDNLPGETTLDQVSAALPGDARTRYGACFSYGACFGCSACFCYSGFFICSAVTS